MASRDQASVLNPWQRYGWLMSVVWLGFLYYPAAALMESRASSWLVDLGWMGTAAFALSYLIGFYVGMRGGPGSLSRPARWLFCLGIGCAALTIPAIGWGALSFVPFLVAYASYVLGGAWHWIVTSMGIALVGGAVLSGASSAWILLAIIVLMAVVNTINIWLIGRSIADGIVRDELVASEEREAVARDVHDLLGHSLTVVKLKAELALRLVDRDPTAARAEIAEIVRLSGEALQGVRSTVGGLRADGLAEQLAQSTAALESGGLRVRVTGVPSALSPAQAIPASWILREATTNVLRHAKAQNVSIAFAPGTLTVVDDGIGARAESGHGIRGMSERAAGAGATFTITLVPELEHSQTRTPHGTKVCLTW